MFVFVNVATAEEIPVEEIPAEEIPVKETLVGEGGPIPKETQEEGSEAIIRTVLAQERTLGEEREE